MNVKAIPSKTILIQLSVGEARRIYDTLKSTQYENRADVAEFVASLKAALDCNIADLVKVSAATETGGFTEGDLIGNAS